MAQKHIWRDRIQISGFGALEDPGPVLLAITLDGLLSELPGALETCILLHAVVVRPVVDLDLLAVDGLVYLGDGAHSNRAFHIDEELHMRGPLLTHL